LNAVFGQGGLVARRPPGSSGTRDGGSGNHGQSRPTASAALAKEKLGRIWDYIPNIQFIIDFL
jgi:hypothetical protein